MTEIMTIDLNLTKTVFHVHGADSEGPVVLRRRLRRSQVLGFFASIPTCMVGLEARASADNWARDLRVLGHKVMLILPQYVRPFVITNDNDTADAGAICEA